MRPALTFSLFGLSILCSGCALVEDSNRNLRDMVKTPIETHLEIARNKKWAETAWQNTCMNSGPRQYSSDYAQGFKDGYAEYLYRGGDGEPPLLPPVRYRHVKYQTPGGYNAVEDWFAGYRHGAAVARDTGARRWITGPTGLIVEPHGPTTHEPAMLVPHRPVEQPETVPLPAPRELPEMSFEQRLPEGVTIEVVEREGRQGSFWRWERFPPEGVTIEVVEQPTPEPMKARITGVSVPAPAFPEAQPEPEPAPTRARITGISVPTTPEEPVRVRIKTITPAKD